MFDPAGCGDIYRAVNSGFDVVGLIDGYFDISLPVWHKELLWALSRGAVIVGAASMGALRAAELEYFGMIGIGRIFRGYLDGSIEGDDEVALLHGPRELGFPNVTVPLVNVRYTLEHIRSQSLISLAEHRCVFDGVREIFYKDRDFEAISVSISRSGLCPDRAIEVSRLLKLHYIDQKKKDALALLEFIEKADMKTLDRQRGLAFTLNETVYWSNFKKSQLEARSQ